MIATSLRRARAAIRRRVRERDEAGYTIVEMIVTLLVVSIVIPIAYGAIRTVVEQTTNVGHLVSSMQQDELAGRTLLQYLHTAYAVDPKSTTSSLSASIESGYDSTNDVPLLATLTATCTPSATSQVGDFVVTVSPFGARPTSTDTYYLEIPSSAPAGTCPVFSYGTDSTSSAGGIDWTGTPTSATDAIEINATLLPGPSVPTEGSAARLSTLQDAIFLEDAAGVPVPSTSDTLSSSTDPAVHSPVVLTSSVLPSPDGGDVAFSVTDPDGIAVSCPASALSSGQSSCTFTPDEAGSYAVSSQYSGDANFQASASPSVTLDVADDTSTALSVQPGGSGYATVTAAVSPVIATTDRPSGTVVFAVTATGRGATSVTPAVCAGGIAVSGGEAVCSGVHVTSGTTYVVSATFTPSDSEFYGSSAQTNWSAP